MFEAHSLVTHPRNGGGVWRGYPRDGLERPCTVGGGGLPPSWIPLTSPSPLPMFQADSQNFASPPSVPRGFKLKKCWPAFGRDYRGTLGGGGSQPNPPPPSLPRCLNLRPKQSPTRCGRMGPAHSAACGGSDHGPGCAPDPIESESPVSVGATGTSTAHLNTNRTMLAPSYGRMDRRR